MVSKIIIEIHKNKKLYSLVVEKQRIRVGLFLKFSGHWEINKIPEDLEHGQTGK